MKLKEIRNRSFRKRIQLNENLSAIIGDFKSHFRLINPAGQNVYLYLIEYVKDFSQFWFKKEFEKLKILDWGCGAGIVSFLLKEIGADVVSCDVEIQEKEEVPIITKSGIKVIQLKHEYLLPFDKNEFDIVLSFGVLEHTPNELESLKEINRILKPKGLFFCFNLLYFLSWSQRLAHLRGNNYHNKFYSRRLVRNLVNESGLNLIDIWHRQLFPKNSIRYPEYHLFEDIDQFLVSKTFLKYFATNIEFVASKKADKSATTTNAISRIV